MASIKEVSEQFAVSQDTLRYYERIHLIPPVTRTPSGIRDYQEEDKNWVEFIKCMRSAGLSIESLIEYVSLFQKGDDTLGARKKILVEQRDQLRERMEEMQRTLKRLDGKIDTYESKIIQCEQRLKKTEEVD